MGKRRWLRRRGTHTTPCCLSVDYVIQSHAMNDVIVAASFVCFIIYTDEENMGRWYKTPIGTNWLNARPTVSWASKSVERRGAGEARGSLVVLHERGRAQTIDPLPNRQRVVLAGSFTSKCTLIRGRFIHQLAECKAMIEAGKHWFTDNLPTLIKKSWI